MFTMSQPKQQKMILLGAKEMDMASHISTFYISIVMNSRRTMLPFRYVQGHI